MTRNPLASSDIRAAWVFTSLMAVAAAYFLYGSIAIADGTWQGRSAILAFAPFALELAFPAVAAFLTWMVVHHYAGAPALNAILVAVAVSVVTGFLVFKDLWDEAAWPRLAITSAVLALICVVVAVTESRLRQKWAAS